MNGLIEAMEEPTLSAPEESSLGEPDKRTRFEAATLPHLAAAYNLARWLTHNDHDAEDVVQEAYLRAFRFFDGFQGGDTRPWLLAIVRNTCITWLKRNRPERPILPFHEAAGVAATDAPEPDQRLLQAASREMVQEALRDLTTEYREIIVLREMDGLSYKEIAAVTGSPIGTVMSRLARGRKLLREKLTDRHPEAF
ncbi:MAG TPA: sigma-70 family RNA polymerase sigma factor [Gemmataceae bacterium]|jgi:RNA polymerase sigma-70 factor (ECF subfamily)|nr:sigma-70 family RNA polymerase sigma factor [Gemmataceae bacterium]